MKTIYLLRHAKSSWADATLADIDRPLSARGKLAAETMATFLADKQVRPSLVLCSSAKRARATLKRVLPGLGSKVAAVIEEALYHAGSGDLMRRLRTLDDTLDSVMLIGHNPAVEELAHQLAAGGDEAALARMKAKFPSGALAVLDTDVKSWRKLEKDGARLTVFVCPRDLG